MIDVTSLLVFANELVTAATTILAFSLAVYILFNNFRSRVAWGFLALLGSLLVVYVGDLVVPYVTSPDRAQRWLRLQWLGISLMPAAYLHLSDAVLTTAGHPSLPRRTAVIGSYALSAFLVALAWFSDLVVRPGTYVPPINQMAAGPLFSFFAAYYAFTVLYGTYTIYQARQRSRTVAAKRRITRMAFAFTVPGLAIFPYLILTPQRTPPLVWGVFLVTLLGNLVVALALVVMAYTVAYYGVFTHDRVVKRNLVRFLLQGPALAVGVVVLTLTLMRLDAVLGLPRTLLVTFGVAGFIVIGQGVLQVIMPWVHRLVYTQDRQELDWLEELEGRLLTSSDLHQYLTNVLMSLCEAMGADRGFIAIAVEGTWRLQAAYGPVGEALDILTARRLAEVLRRILDNNALLAEWPWVPDGPFLIAPLHAEDDGIIGLVGVGAQPPLTLDASGKERVQRLLEQARAAVADFYLQRQIFALVQATMPTIARLQRVHGPVQAGQEMSPLVTGSEADFVQWVRDALRHFWGGPKLQESPLLNLRVVAEEAEAQGTPRTRALQQVLLRAIERLRPEGQRQMTTSEWLLYNILELKFIQGKRVREIAQRLAMSESDLYRKQRVAIAEVARILREMEAERVLPRESILTEDTAPPSESNGSSR